MNDKDIVLFVEAIANYFQVMTGSDAKVGAPFLIEDLDKHLLHYTGIIAISGGYKGSVLYSAEYELLSQVLKHLGVQKADNSKITDLAGEISNIVAGNVRAQFGEQFFISVPRVLDYSETKDLGLEEGNRRIFCIPIHWNRQRSNLIVNVERD